MDPEIPNGENTQTADQEPPQQTEKKPELNVSSKQIAIRLLYTILFLFVLGIVIIIVKLAVLFQFIILFSTREPNESVRQFSNKLSCYGYQLFRYITLNESRKPFPFTDFPSEMESSDEQIAF